VGCFAAAAPAAPPALVCRLLFMIEILIPVDIPRRKAAVAVLTLEGQCPAMGENHVKPHG
jgi:hypothetical protein